MNFLIHYFLPHSSNNHRARAIHPDFLFIYILFLFVFNFLLSSLHNSMPQVLGYATDIYVDQLLSSTNSKRTEAGLAPLNLNQKLSDAAQQKAQDMFANNYWAHTSPTGKTPWDFITKSGYSYSVAGENLAKNFSTSQAVVDAWMASPTHKDNIIKPQYRDVGFAVINGKINGEETTLVVQMFGSSREIAAINPKKVQAAPSTANPTVKSTPQPTIAPVYVEVPDSKSEDNSAVSNEEYIVTENAPVPGLLENFAIPVNAIAPGISENPKIDMMIFKQASMIMFIGLFMTVLIIDFLVSLRRRTVRSAGHNLAHFIFLAILAILVSTSVRGRIL